MMNEPDGDASKPADSAPLLSNVFPVRIMLAFIASVSALLALYLSFLIFVRWLSLDTLSAPVGIPMLLAVVIAQLGSPRFPSSDALLEGSARLEKLVLRTYVRRETAVLILSAMLCVLLFYSGTHFTTTSVLRNATVRGDHVVMTFQPRLLTAPPFLMGLRFAILAAAFGTGFASAISLANALKLRTVVDAMDDSAAG